jgi:hypothetical protein
LLFTAIEVKRALFRDESHSARQTKLKPRRRTAMQRFREEESMTLFKAQEMRATVLIVFSSVCMAASGADLRGALPVDAETKKQTSIYESRGQDVPQGYVIDRSLLSYMFVLPAGFKTHLANLGAGDRWLDIGAGEGRAILDYATGKYDGVLQERDGKAAAVGMSIEDRRTPRWHETAAALEPGRIQYLMGKRFREYSPQELGRFELMTDVVGAFSYTRTLSQFIELAVGSLRVNGALYTLLQDIRTEQRTNRPYYPEAPFLTELAGPDGSEVTVCSWLKSISCVEVSCEAKPKFPPPIEVYQIRKTCDAVVVPPLELVHFQAGTPPERRFRLTSPAQR